MGSGSCFSSAARPHWVRLSMLPPSEVIGPPPATTRQLAPPAGAVPADTIVLASLTNPAPETLLMKLPPCWAAFPVIVEPVTVSFVPLDPALIPPPWRVDAP